MAFDNIYNFVFYDILKFDPSSTVLTGELQNDIIFGLLVPAVFIFILLYFFVYHQFGAGSKFLGTLSSLTAFGVIITLGWVPLIAGLGGFAFVLILFLALLRGIYSRLIPKGVDTKIYGAGKWLGKTAAKKIDITDPTLTHKDKTKLAKDLQICDFKFGKAESAAKAIEDKYKNVRWSSEASLGGGGGNVKDTEHRNATSEMHLYHETMATMIDEAENIVKKVPKSERREFIIHNTKKGDFQERLLKIEYLEDNV